MKKILNIITLPLLFSALFFAAGCEEDISPYIVEGSDIPQVYVKSMSPHNIVVSGSNIKQVTIPYLSNPGSHRLYFKLPAFITKTVSSDVEVTFGVDESLVENYNAIPPKDNAGFYPAGMTVSLGAGKVTIPAGATASRDSVEMTVTIPVPGAVPEGRFVIPVKIASVSGGDAVIASTNNVLYVPFDYSYWNTRDDYTSAPLGSVQDNYSGWTVTSTPSLTNPNNMLNTATNNYASLSSAQTLTFTVDMASVRSNVSGFGIRMSSTSYRWSKVKVETSTDNSTWVEQGSPILGFASNYHYIVFRARIPSMRYVRISVLEWPASTTSFRIVRFQAYW